METREKTITDAASRVFLRFGVKRTTMNDIAQEAGISRQTLYNAFSNKDDVLRGLIQVYNADAVAAIRRDYESAADLAEKLDVVFEHMIIRPHDLLNSSPHAQDLLQGMNSMAQDEIALQEAQFPIVIAEALAAHATALAEVRLTAEQIANMIFCASKGAKYHTRTRDEMLSVLATIRSTVLHLAKEA
ncbi:MAG: helix-turn-helix domain-containing protein [Pseudomonadota bacterium]